MDAGGLRSNTDELSIERIAREIGMISVSDMEYIRDNILDIFPNAVRGSVAKSLWGRGRKVLHLSYYICSDTVGGLKAIGKGDLIYFVEWDTNEGHIPKFAESDVDTFIKRVRENHAGKVQNIEKVVSLRYQDSNTDE